MPIYRRGKTWWYSITINGKTHRNSCKTQDERQAQEKHDTERARLWRVAHLGEKPRRTWKEGVERWMKDHEHKRSRADDERYEAFWSDRFKDLELVYLDELEPDVVGDIVDELAERENRYGEPIAKATINRYLSFLRAVINSCARKYMWLQASPVFAMFEETERLRYLTHEELFALLDALPETYRSMALFAVSTGLRRANVFGLTWGQVNWQRRSVTFPGQVMKNGSAFSIPLNDTAMRVLRGQQGAHDSLVFPRWDGMAHRDIPPKMWRKALAEAEIADFRWHDLRHTWASWLRQDGETLDRIQELGGWEDPTMVQRYAHLDVSHLAGSASRIDRLVERAGRATVHSLHRVA